MIVVKVKAEFFKDFKVERDIKRGDVYMVDLGIGIGSEHRGNKYCVVVQNDRGNKFSPTTTIVPITSHKKRIITHVEIGNVVPVDSRGITKSYVVCEQIRTISKDRLGKMVSRLTDEQIESVNDKIMIQLGL